MCIRTANEVMEKASTLGLQDSVDIAGCGGVGSLDTTMRREYQLLISWNSTHRSLLLVV